MDKKNNNHITEPEDLFGVPDHLDTPDIAQSLQEAKRVLNAVRSNADAIAFMKNLFANPISWE